VVLAEDLAAAVQGVPVQVEGGLRLAQLAQVCGQDIRGVQGAEVVLAEDPAVTLQGVLGQVLPDAEDCDEGGVGDSDVGAL
jgi:hypothetical protein